ncbi:NAD(P)H-dependent oxidoreductase [Celeribacter arenosi]|uniref:NAD(P)H-dependent oxidoreductase n=2 Tax=Celeribacter arenosi TaxID=792649 RepID=A0ABP7K7N0_9RHOB
MLDNLDWRYAVKKMDPTKPVSDEKIAGLLKAIRFAPTSSGLQPFKVFVITNTETREKIAAAAMNQAQILEGSHVLVFAGFDNYTEERIEEVVAQHAEERPGTREALDAYYDMLKSIYLPRDAHVNAEHAARQAYIALGFALAAAAELEIDTTPMEGFDPAAVDAILGLPEQGLKSLSILAVGTRAEEGDWLVNMKKVRKPDEALFVRID